MVKKIQPSVVLVGAGSMGPSSEASQECSKYTLDLSSRQEERHQVCK
jgi:hypothetical protein